MVQVREIDKGLVGKFNKMVTISGTEKHERGCLLELTWGGKEPITLSSGEQRTFLKDGDEILMTGFCKSKNG